MTDPRILFCCGATKAGTSWLHRWLGAHEAVHLRSIKETHFFDALERGTVGKRIAELRAEHARAAGRGAPPERLADFDALVAALQTGTDGAYLEYITWGRGTAEVVGDITPSYGLLPVPWLRRLAALGDTRFLYILRDPVERLWSHVRMIAGRREPSGMVTEARAARILKRTLRGDETEIARRSDYRGALERLMAAVPGPQRLFVFFEELFAGDAAGRISDFLGIGRTPALARVVHGGQSLRLSLDQREAGRAWLSEQYDFVEDVMGYLPPSWAKGERV